MTYRISKEIQTSNEGLLMKIFIFIYQIRFSSKEEKKTNLTNLTNDNMIIFIKRTL